MNGQTIAARSAAKRNLLIAALDAAFAKGLIVCDDVHRSFQFEIVGLPVIAIVRTDADEIFISVVVAPTALGRRLNCAVNAKMRAPVGAATAVGWLDKHTGQFLEIRGGFHAANHIVPLLAQASLITKERQASSHRCNTGRIGHARPARA
ncbi:hypothetical protein ABIF68_010401 [Bradyrhizobium japonicum]|jgi:hypothetical protein|uniref:hypothetical protein n=1 Tax=Bradyrhizobium TaxID=374 RepID=UPI0004B9BC5E|nr:MULTISPECIES: hypothetical protein [Bradyrhizobium]MDI2076509.1 hypothetical protein [Bradyrhizobium sp. Mp27]